MLNKIFKALSLSIIKTPYIYLAIIIVVTLVSLYFAYPIKIDTDLMKMAPPHDPYVESYMDYLDNTGGGNFSILMINTDKDPKKAELFAKEVVQKLKNTPKYVKYIVSYRDENLVDKYGLYYLSNSELSKLKLDGSNNQNYISYIGESLQKGIRAFKNTIKLKPSRKKTTLFPKFPIPNSSDILQSTKAFFNSIKELYSYIYPIQYYFGNVQPIIDSFKIYTITTGIVNSSKYLNDIQKVMNNFEKLRTQSYYQLTPDKKYIIVTMIMAKPSSDLNFVEDSVKQLNKITKSINKKYNMQYGFTGAYATIRDNKNAISYSLQSTTIFSLLGIILIFAFAYRRLSYILTVILVLIISTIWLLAAVNLTIGHFNAITSFMIATLLGLGIDYSIHLTAVYIQERQKGGISEEGIIISLREIGPSITIGALTTAASFLILIIAPSQAFRELAIIASLGILIYWAVSIITIPTILAIFRKGFKPRKRTKMERYVLKPLSIMTKNHSKLILTIFILLSMALSYYSFKTINNFD
jgi:predicted RND superfamily exporter protein